MTDTGLPLDLTPDQRRESILSSLRKAVMGRSESRRDVARVADEVGPLVDEASRQPDLSPIFRRMAADQGITEEEARSRWVHLQEADILLESGGDPEAVSSAGAVGVSQWMPGAGTHGTLKIDAKKSAALTAQIAPLEWKVAWLKYWRNPDPPLHGAPPAGVPVTTAADAAQKLPALQAELHTLRAARKQIDRRYDPPAAIQAQTRYLLGLYNRFPSPDWLFQAYHGGEAGVDRLLRRYLGPEWPGSSSAAITSGNGGRTLTFEDVYLGCTPTQHRDAFLYLYGRGDDHRHYWWKLLMAERAIALSRRDSKKFDREWLALAPGQGTDGLWYPAAARDAVKDLRSLKAATVAGRLQTVTANDLLTVRPAPLDKANSATYGVLRPETLGLLRLVAASYSEAGGTSRLTAGDCTLTPQYLTLVKSHFPASGNRHPMPPDKDFTPPSTSPLPPRFNFHRTGFVVDVLRPNERTDRKLLEYTLGYFKDRGILTWREESTGTEPRHYHLVPNPKFQDTLAAIRPEQWPELPGF